MASSYKKIHIIADANSTAQSAKRLIAKKYKNSPINDSDVLVVLGGDGFMLASLKKYQKYQLPFYGMNKGNRGFLLNKFDEKDLINKINKSKIAELHPLEMYARNKNGKVKTAIAVNEVSVFRETRQAAKLEIKIDNKIRMKEVTCDGVLVATPAGSTAYNLSVRGPVLDLESNLLAVTPISPFKPRGWRGATINNRSKVSIKNLDFKKRPVSVVADNIEFRDVSNVSIYLNKNKTFKLLYDKKYGLKERNLAEQFKF
ncbi:NAD kinase [Candidatus Pelagibacterales bacterium]|nr:NAD kinase [Pelagibacterales bacterium]